MIRRLLLLIIVSIGELNFIDCKIQYKRSVMSALKDNGVIPDVIDIVPKDKVQVLYPNKVEVNYNELKPVLTKDEPTVKWPAEEGQYYTLTMTDPDAPSREEPTFGQVKHWLVMNIPGTDIKNGENLAEYIGPTPPEGTGLHRYIFLVFKQTSLLNHSETAVKANVFDGRIRFKVREFSTKYNLGQPIAVNFFQAQSDDYSRELWAKRAKEGFSTSSIK